MTWFETEKAVMPPGEDLILVWGKETGLLPGFWYGKGSDEDPMMQIYGLPKYWAYMDELSFPADAQRNLIENKY
jgi:hypothetical protein